MFSLHRLFFVKRSHMHSNGHPEFLTLQRGWTWSFTLFERKKSMHIQWFLEELCFSNEFRTEEYDEWYWYDETKTPRFLKHHHFVKNGFWNIFLMTRASKIWEVRWKRYEYYSCVTWPIWSNCFMSISQIFTGGSLQSIVVSERY